MLQAIRSKASSFIVKILFGLLIITFGIWGIADIFTNRSTDTTVATVGGRDISLDELSTAVQIELQRLQSVVGHPIDAAQAKKLGIVDAVLQRVIDGVLADLEANHLHLKIGDDAVRQAIIDNPSFRNQSGVFDRDLFDSVLATNHMSEQQFVTHYRDDLLRDQLAGAVTDGWTAPKELTDTLFRRRFERRVADEVTLPASAAGAVATPSADEVNAYYAAHQSDFLAPELRSFTLAMLSPVDIAAAITVPDDKLQKEYKERQNEFTAPEQRDLLQLLLPNEAKAKEAEAELAAGKDFTAVGKAVANADPKSIDLGWVKRSDLPPALAEAAFALKVGQTTAPIQSEFGWHIVRLAAIKPGVAKTFAEVKDVLAKEVALDEASDQAADTANKIDDALAGGASFKDVAQKFGLKTTDVADVDAQGHDSQGRAVPLPPPSLDIVKVAFATASGQTSDLTQLGRDAYFLVYVSKITPAATRPLAAVHDEVVKQWQAEATRAALEKQATALAAEVSAGKTLKQVAAAHKLTVTTSKPLTRDTRDADTPPALLGKLFRATSDQAVFAPVGDAYVVAQVTTITPADPSADPGDVQTMNQQLDASLQDGVLTEFDQALRGKYSIETNQANIDRAL